MRRTLLAVAALLIATVGLHALDASNPLDDVYTWLDLWERRGLVEPLPHLKPYPIQLIDSLLRQVAERGGPTERDRAERYLSKIGDSGVPGVVFYSSSHGTQADYFGMTGFYLTLSDYLLPSLTASGYFGGVILAEPSMWHILMVPGDRPERDYTVDWASVTVEGISLLPTMSGAGAFAFGTDSLWFQAGANRSAFGPFDEGIVLSPQAAMAGHFSLSWRRPRFTYSEYLLALTATKDDGTALEDDGDVAAFPDKYLAGQVFQVRATDWLELGFYETIVFGERLELLYLVPAIPRIYSSVATGAVDNIMLGLSASARLPRQMGVDFMLYADDLLALDFDTKYKVAGQIGVSWTPLGPWLKGLSLDYALATPYTYTHRRESIVGEEEIVTHGINYDNYTHAGRSLVALDPNSDRLRLNACFAAPVPRVGIVDAVLFASFRRHANATTDPYVDTTFEGTDDGGINDNGYDKLKPDHNFDTVKFLSQDVVEKILLLGVEATHSMPVVACGGHLDLTAGYTLELAWNKRGEDPNDTRPVGGNNQVVHHIRFGLAYEF